MAKVELKKPVVEEISENIKDAESVILVQYCGITVEADTQLRKELREAGVTYKVYKNTMMNFAFKGTDCEALSKHLEGPNAIAISKTDATAPARIISKYAKQAPTMKMIAGSDKPGWVLPRYRSPPGAPSSPYTFPRYLPSGFYNREPDAEPPQNLSRCWMA